MTMRFPRVTNLTFIALLFSVNRSLGQTSPDPELFSESTTIPPADLPLTEVIATDPPTSILPTTEPPPPPETLPELEIVEIGIIPSLGNAVKLIWGGRSHDLQDTFNWTYGVYYGGTLDELQVPRNSTTDLFAVVKDLEFCKKYYFGVGVIENYGRIDQNSSYIRSVITYADKSALPKNVSLDFEPGVIPCMVITWSASCPTVGQPIGYLISILEKPSTKLSFAKIPPTRQSDLRHVVPVKYGTTYEVKLSTSDSGFNTTDIVSYHTPYFLQPYKVRVTLNPDGTFMVFWREPYVPPYVGPYYYELYVYAGRNVSDEFQVVKVNKSVYIHETEEYICTFSVGLTSESGMYKSFLSQPMVADKNGEVYMIEIYNDKNSNG